MRVSGCRHVCSLLVLALLVTGAASLAQARHWRHERDHERDVASGNGRHQEHGIGGIFAGSIDEMIRSCSDQAAALRILPSDPVVQTLRPNESQHAALEQVRVSAAAAAEGLDANCPKRNPVGLGAKLDVLNDALGLILDTLGGLRPALLNLYGLLDDEQKGRLIAAGLSGRPTSRPVRTPSRTDPVTGTIADPDAKSPCTQWAANLRTWPVRQIDAAMQLSDPQRAALYELSAAIFRSAGDLVEACPTENPVTPLGRLDATRNQLQALQQDIGAIRPSATAFESALNESQKKRFAEAMDSESP